MKHKKIVLALAAIGVFACMQTAPQAEQVKTLLGDVNETGSIELDDAASLLKMALKIDPVAEEKQFYYDMNGNGNVDLDDAAMVLKQALKINPVTFYRSFEEELLVASVSDKGIGYAFSNGTYKGNAATADGMLKKYGLFEEAKQLEDKLGDKLETAQVFLTVDRIYADRIEDVTCQAVSLKESSGELFTDMEESAREQDGIRIQDSRAKELLRIYSVDADTAVEKSIVEEKTEADVVMDTEPGKKVEPLSCTVIDDYPAYQEFLKNHTYEHFPECEEAFFEKNRLVVYGGTSQFQDENAVRRLVIDREQGVLNILESHRQDEVQVDANGGYGMDYIIRMPKDILSQENLYVQVQPDAVAGYEEVTGNAISVHTDAENSMKYQWITDADSIKADNFTVVPMDENDTVWQQLKEKLSSVDYKTSDVLVVRQSKMQDYQAAGYYVRWKNGVLKVVQKYEKMEDANNTSGDNSSISLIIVDKGLLQKGSQPELELRSWYEAEKKMVLEGVYNSR